MSASVLATAPSPVPAATTDRCHEGTFGDARLLGELLVASGRHDEDAFARFYRLTSPWIYSLLSRCTGSTADAEEAMVRAYAATWRQAATFVRDQSALAWMTRVAFAAVPTP